MPTRTPGTLPPGAYVAKSSLDVIASIEELTQVVPFATVTATTTAAAWIAPFPCKIVAASLLSYGANIPASTVNYWSVTLRKLVNNAGTVTSSVIAVKTSRSDTGQAVTGKADWNFDNVPFDPVAQNLAKGDVLDVLWGTVGAPPQWTAPLLVFRYEPSS